MADEHAEAAELDDSGWMIFFGIGLLFTLVTSCFAALGILSAMGVIGVQNSDPKPINFGVLGAMLAMYSLGPALMYFGWSEHAPAARAKKLRAQFPGKPWKWDARLSAGTIPANAASEAFWAWYGASALALFLAPFLIQLLIISFDWRFLILAPFVAVDAFLFRFAWRRTFSARRYGKLALQLSQLPLVPGKSFEATLKIPASLEGSGLARLTCDKTTVRKKGETRTEIVFDTAKDVSIAVSGATSVIKVAFELPEKPHGLSFTWRLELTAPALSEQFDLPVFPASEADVEHFTR